MRQVLLKGIVFLGLMLGSVHAWGQCYIINESATKELKLSSGTVATYTWNASQKTNGQVSFEAKTSMTTTSNAKNITLQQTLDGNSWSDVKTYTLTSKYATYTCSSLSKDARGIRFQVGGIYTRSVQNVTVGYGTHIGDPSAGSLSFGNVFVDDATVTKTLTIAWCNTGELTATLPTNSQYSVSIANNASTCTYGTATVSVVYNHTSAGTHNETLTITGTNYSKTISLSGTANQHSQILTWNNETAIDLNMMMGTNQRVTASATSGLKVTYESSNDAVLSVDENGNLLAKSVGTAVVTASQSGNAAYAAATPIAKTIQVKSKDTPTWIPNGFAEIGTNNLKVDEKVILQVSNVSDGLSGLFAMGNYDSNVLSISRADNMITIMAVGEGSTSVTFRQTETATIFAAEKTYSFAVSKVENMLTVAEIHEMYVDDVATYVVGNKQSDGVITTTSTDATVAYYDVVQNKLLAVNTNNQSFDEKEVTITISQAATNKYTAANKSIVVKVKKYDNKIFINGQQGTYTGNIYMDGYDNIALTATNTDYVGCPIDNLQTEGMNLATFYPNEQVIYTTNILGTATWTLTQQENYKYKAATANMTIHVIKASEATDCYVLNEEATVAVSAYKSGHDYVLSAAGKDLMIDARKVNAATYGIIIYGYDSNGNRSTLIELNNNTLTTNFKTYTVTNLDNITKIRVEATGGTLDKEYKSLRVTRKTYLTASDVTVSKTSSKNDIYPAQEGVGELVVNYALANGGDLKMSWDNAKFVVNGKTSAEGVNLGNLDCTTGVVKLPISYSSEVAGTDVANVVIYNAVYRVATTITGVTVKRSQVLTWKPNFSQMTIGQEESEAATATLGGVTYTSSDPSIIRVDNGNKLVAVAQGKATITAFAQGNSEYDDVSSTLEITVADKQVQYIHWNQSLLRLHVGDDNVVLNAYASQDEALGCSDSSRPISYVSSNEEVVRVVEGNQLQVVGIGSAVLTATQTGGRDADGHDYIPVSQEKKVVVIDPNAPCETYIYEQTAEHTFSLGWNAANKQTKTFEIDFNGQEPGYCNFDYKGEPQKVLINYYDGDMYIDELVDGVWKTVKSLGQPSTSGYTSTGNVALSRKATKMRVRVKDGMGFQYVKDCQVTLARYLESSTPEVFQAKVGSMYQQTIDVRYSNASANLTFALPAGSPFQLDKEALEAGCGDKGTTTLTISYVPNMASNNDAAVLHVTDGVALSLDVNLLGMAEVTQRTLIWSLPEVSNVLTKDTIYLSASVLTEQLLNAGDVVFSLDPASTTGSITDGNVLSFETEGTAYVVATVVPDARYNDIAPVTRRVDVKLPPVYEFTGQGTWNESNEWHNQQMPDKDAAVDVLVNGDLYIDSDVSVSSLTINTGASVRVMNDGHLTILAGSKTQTEYGNIYIEDGGQVTLEGEMNVQNLIISSSIGTADGTSASGQLEGVSHLKLSDNGAVYIDIHFDPSGSMDDSQWYGFSVPFAVDMTNGVSRLEGSIYRSMKDGQHFMVYRYDANRRLNTGKGWVRHTGTLLPGQFYYFTVNGNYNTYRFRAASKDISTTTTLPLIVNGSGSHANWNALANTTLEYASAAFTNVNNLPTFVQVYQNGLSSYKVVATEEATLVVGCPFFVQATQSCDLTFSAPASTSDSYYAPQRNATISTPMRLQIVPANGGVSDQLYISLSDESTTTYTLGADLAKAGVGTRSAQIWIDAYGQQLCVHRASCSEQQTTCLLGMSAPQAGDYQLSLSSVPEDKQVLLMYKGQVVADLASGECEVALSRGTCLDYALCIIPRMGVATDMEQAMENAAAQKILYSGQVAVLRDGKLYSVTGELLSK